MSAGHYVVTPNRQQRDIVFNQIRDADTEPTDAERDLIVEVERTLGGLAGIYPSPERDKEYDERFRILVDMAKAGLEGENAQPAFAARMLTVFRAEVVDREAGRMKNRYMATLGAASVRFALPAIVVGVVAALSSTYGFLPTKMAPLVSNAAFLVAACAAGVWVSFGARKAQVSFEDLSVPERDFLSPNSRLAFSTILTLALALIFHVGAAEVVIGTFKTSDVFANLPIALIVGFLCGFSEQVLAKSIAAQAQRLIGS